MPDERIHSLHTHITTLVSKSKVSCSERLDLPPKSKHPELAISPIALQTTWSALWTVQARQSSGESPADQFHLASATKSSADADTVTSQSPKSSCCGYSHPMWAAQPFGVNVIIATALSTLQSYAGISEPADVPATPTTSSPMSPEAGPTGLVATGTLAVAQQRQAVLPQPKPPVPLKHHFQLQPFPWLQPQKISTPQPQELNSIQNTPG